MSLKYLVRTAMSLLVFTLIVLPFSQGSPIAAQSSQDGLIAFGLGNFVKNTWTGNRIYLMNPDGSDERRLTQNDDISFENAPSFSPDGTQIVFGAKTSSTAPFNLYVIGVDSSNIKMLPQTTNAGGALWSPDGKYLVFRGAASADSVGLYLYDMLAQTSSLLVADTKTDYWFPVEWFPDSQNILYKKYSNDATKLILYEVGLNGSQPKSIKSQNVSELKFSQDGKQIVACQAQNRKISLLKSLTDTPTVVESLANKDNCPVASTMAWSPDDTSVAYLIQSGSNYFTAEFRLETLNLQTKKVTVVKKVSMVTDNEILSNVVWSTLPNTPATSTQSATMIATTSVTASATAQAQ